MYKFVLGRIASKEVATRQHELSAAHINEQLVHSNTLYRKYGVYGDIMFVTFIEDIFSVLWSIWVVFIFDEKCR